ncbi:YheC/YheD family protein [Bacillus sp. BRMEA1]|uniref:YheC/YheD family endospore coat-associated protein n=1 Tax=Neobacillus endophyticus TaxID=2738405 RepID=UPI0015650E0D|nr:YheC/YheD family protein [Neobacillus endophyticus]NRD78344.1 YheC/YheD family protein [Neobacillus endophyticus]
MLTFGIMSLSLESEEAYMNEIALHAEPCGMECYRFIPSQINPHTLHVNGKKFDTKTKRWINKEFPIPSIIYDRCFYGEDEHSKQCMPIISWLKNRKDITFLGYGLPNKLELYHALKNTPLSPYLPPTQPASNVKMVLKEMADKKRIILKPINGAHGYGIYTLKQNDKTILVKTEKQKQMISRIFPNEAKLNQWLQSLLSKRPYLIQPYLDLVNENLEPFDIRVLLQKNEFGNWGELGRGIRHGSPGGILSNLSAGGSCSTFSEWASSLPVAKAEYMSQEIGYILSELPLILENAFLPLFEIGVDIGVAQNGSIWILDINSKPGRKVLLQTRPDVKETLYLAPLLYGKYLSETDQSERKNFYEKTLSH